ATTELYPLSLHDALPISSPTHSPSATLKETPSTALTFAERRWNSVWRFSTSRTMPGAVKTQKSRASRAVAAPMADSGDDAKIRRSEEHTSELQSPYDLVC